MGVAVMPFSLSIAHNSLPVFESKARKRLSPVAAMNTSPPAVAIGPPEPALPAFFFPSGIALLIPKGTLQAISPVLAFTATKLDHGGLKHGSPIACSPGALARVYGS